VECAHRSFCTIVGILALVLTVEYHRSGGVITHYCSAGNIQPWPRRRPLSAPKMPSKLRKEARDDIQLQLEAGTRPDIIANSYRINER
jgi:hypothetical protein